MKHPLKRLYTTLLAGLFATSSLMNNPINSNSFIEEKLTLTQTWDKVFPQSDKVDHSKTYYNTKRGYHKRSLNSNGGWNQTSSLSFLNMPILTYAGEIRNAVLLVHGEKAHSR